MTTIQRPEILTKDEYLACRDAWRRKLLVEKGRRRIGIGENCTVHFESRETLLYQIQEMLRVEESWERAGAIEDEIEAYGPLVPGDGALSATVMFEYEDPDERARMLTALVGVHEHVWIAIGDLPRVAAEFDALGLDPDKVSSVQYVKWHLPAEHRTALQQDGVVVRLVLDHPSYQAQTVLSEQSRTTIMHDAD